MNYSTEQFYRALNESVSTDENFNKWSSYREDVTAFAVNGMWKNGSCFILGAGNIFDIDLNKVSEKSDEIVLSDIDIASVYKGLKLYDNTSGKAAVEMIDIAEMDKNRFMNNIHDYFVNNDIDKLIKYLQSYKFNTEYETINYDNVFVSAIYTQLFIPQLLTLLKQQDHLSTDIKKQILDSSLAFAAKLIAHVNDLVMKLAADDATVCSWSDVLEYENGDLALNDIKNHIDDKKWMDSMYEIYIRDYGHGLGSYGLSDLTERLSRVEEKWIVWPFSDSRTLVVKIISGTVTS